MKGRERGGGAGGLRKKKEGKLPLSARTLYILSVQCVRVVKHYRTTLTPAGILTRFCSIKISLLCRYCLSVQGARQIATSERCDRFAPSQISKSLDKGFRLVFHG